MGGAVTDIMSGAFLAQGSLIALLDREVSGQGRWVQTSLIEAGLTLLDFQATRWTMDKKVPPQEGNYHPTNVPMGLYPTADGFLNLAATSNKNFKLFCKLIDREKTAADPRFATSGLRARNKEALNELIATALRAKTSREWFEIMVEAGLPCGPVYNIRDAFADPQVGAGFKYMHSVFTGLVALPTLLTVFTICASAEIASRLRGGRGAFGWVSALPWQNPIMLATALSLVMLGFGGAGGLINMSYQLDASIHNTQWITGHFHLIFGGAIVIMYFAIAYDLWPHLTGRALENFGLMRTQLWLWFIGMIVTTFPWHYVGILGMPRRMAFYDYANPAISPQAFSVSMSVIGGFILLTSGALFLTVLVRGQMAANCEAGAYRFSVPLHMPARIPAALNSFGLWLALMIGLTIVNYGYPIAQLMVLKETNVPAVYVGASR